MTHEPHIITGRCRDGVALAEVEAAQRVINHYIGENFVTDFCRDEKGFFGFCYDPQCFADRAKRLADGDTA
ncbi:hypothetical protein [Pseudorhodobacter sp.]|uniref:hypothetical protein n=1 Tax=Pseudorhodobacter sp. TaxID=1934400 RepID=UPI0026480FF8|nr:hypothetical protein [Pseudorhodobacter sp.]MDN5787161.1 hypothetical protein [Pseudorhodobacter sp.]